MKNIKKNGIIMLLITIVVLVLVIKDDFYEIVNALTRAIVREYREKIKVSKIFKQITITQFFNGITPFASGGQPMQVYMLNKSGIKLTHSTNIIVQDFILYQMALITHGIIAVLLNYHYHFLQNNPFLRNLTIIGFLINTLVGIGLLFKR